MLRGRPKSTVSPVSASMLATDRLSGRRPQRSEPESPPSSSTLKRPSVAPETWPSVNIAPMKSFWTPTTWEANSSEPATPKHRTPLIPTIARRCFCRRASGSPSRHASMNRRAQADGQHDQHDPHQAEHEGVAEQPEDERAEQHPETEQQHHGHDQPEPDTQRDPADLLATRHQLGRAGKHQRHQHQHHRPAELRPAGRAAVDDPRGGGARIGGQDWRHGGRPLEFEAWFEADCGGIEGAGRCRPVSPVTCVTAVTARRGSDKLDQRSRHAVRWNDPARSRPSGPAGGRAGSRPRASGGPPAVSRGPAAGTWRGWPSVSMATKTR